MDALGAGQFAAVAADRTAIALLQQERPGSLRMLAEIARRPYVAAVRADATTPRAEIDEALATLIASGEIRDLARRAGFPYEAP